MNNLMSLENLPFSAWVIHKMNTSTVLNPPVCELRPIGDEGSINESLKTSKVNLFDRTLIPTYSSLDLVRKVTRVVLFELSAFAIPISIGYHTSLLAIHSFSLFFQNEEDKIKTWNKVVILAKNIFIEIVDFASFGICMTLGLKMLYDLTRPSALKSIPLRIFTSIIAGGLGLGLISYEGGRRMSMNNPSGSSMELRRFFENFNNKIPIDPDHSYCYRKALFLRDQFGIVGPNNELLSYDPKEDQDIAFTFVYDFKGARRLRLGIKEDQNVSPLLNLREERPVSPQEVINDLLEGISLLEGESIQYKPTGYFSSIYIEERRKKINNFISLIFNSDCFSPKLGKVLTSFVLDSLKRDGLGFVDPLKKENLIEILENNKDHLGISSNKIEDLKKRIESLEDNATLITDFIEEAYRTCYLGKHVIYKTSTREFSRIASLKVNLNRDPLKEQMILPFCVGEERI